MWKENQEQLVQVKKKKGSGEGGSMIEQDITLLSMQLVVHATSSANMNYIPQFISQFTLF